MVVFGATVVRAEPISIDGAAEVGQTATRVHVADEGLAFPIEPTPMCEVFNNFGGYSKAFGTGGHQGVDIGAQLGQEVYAVEDGILYRRLRQLVPRGSGGACGRTPTRSIATTTSTPRREGLEVGDRVTRGQLIGYVGDTGNATPGGWHLHFEVRPGPEPYWHARSTRCRCSTSPTAATSTDPKTTPRTRSTTVSGRQSPPVVVAEHGSFGSGLVVADGPRP